MATQEQARMHYQFLEEQARVQADLRAQEQERANAAQTAQLREQARIQQERDQLLAGYSAAAQERQGQWQGALAQQQAGFQENRDQRQFGYQNFMFDRQSQEQERMLGLQEGVQARRDVRQVDLQARLNEITLTQNETLRINKLKESIARVREDPDLAPHERNALITQLQTGLNPLENRMRESQMIHTNLQSEALFQQTAQSAELFNQRQAHIARGIAGNLQTITDPVTGVQQLFYADQNGNPTMLDFGQRAEQHAANMATQFQQFQQSGDMHPLRVEGARIGNQQGAFNLRRGEQLLPGEVNLQNAQVANIAQNTAASQMLTPVQRDEMRARITSTLDDNARRNDLHPDQVEALTVQNLQAWSNLAQFELEGPGRVRHLNELVRGLELNNNFAADTFDVRRQTTVATLNGLLQANEIHKETMPALVKRANLEVQRLMEEIRDRGEARPETIRNLQLRNMELQQSAAGQWLRNLGVVNQLLGGGQGQQGAAGAAAGGAGAGRMTTQQVSAAVDRDIRDENARRSRAFPPRPAMTAAEERAYRQERLELHSNSITNIMAELRTANGGQGPTREQAERIRIALQNAPQFVREAIGQAAPAPAREGDVDFTGPTQPQSQTPSPNPNQPQASRPGAGRNLMAVRDALNRRYSQEPVYNRVPGLEGPDNHNIGRMQRLLSSAVNENRTLTPEERNDYEQRWATLPEEDRQIAVYPGMQFHGQITQLENIRERLRDTAENRRWFAGHMPTIGQIRFLVNQAVEQGRGLTSYELEQYNRLMSSLPTNHYGLFIDENRISTPGRQGPWQPVQ